MKDYPSLRYTKMLMIQLNLLIILYYSLICYVTTYRICRSFGAYDFLSDVGMVPNRPWLMPVCSLSAYGLLILIINRRWEEKGTGFSKLLPSIAKIGLCLLIILSINYYYSGILLLVMADLVTYERTNRSRTLLVAFLMTMYALWRYDVMSYAVQTISFSSYLSYYTPYIQSYLSWLASIMDALNGLLFVWYMVILFTGQKYETERIQSLYGQLMEANTKLKEYNVQLERMTEIRERNRLAREIHDTLGHTLTGIIMSSEVSAALLETDPAQAKTRMISVAQSARDGLNDVRQSIKALRPDALEKHSLEQALQTMMENFRKNTSVKIDFQQEAGKLDFAEDEEDTLYRIIQECMTNAVRHGHADEIKISLKRHENYLTIDIRDNGCGCENIKEGFGLRHMQERLDLLSGSLTYGNRADDMEDGSQGFYLIATMPVRKKEEGGQE